MDHSHHTHEEAKVPVQHEHSNHVEKNPPMGHAGHDHHAMMIDDFKKRFYIVLLLTVPIMLLSEMIQHWLNIHFSFPGSNYVLFALSSVVFFYGGLPFLKGSIYATLSFNAVFFGGYFVIEKFDTKKQILAKA